jgi:hypothetical protein
MMNHGFKHVWSVELTSLDHASQVGRDACLVGKVQMLLVGKPGDVGRQRRSRSWLITSFLAESSEECTSPRGVRLSPEVGVGLFQVNHLRVCRLRALQLRCIEVEASATTHRACGFEYLEKAFRQHEPRLVQLLHSPELAWMRSDPRFAALRKKANLSP